MPSRLMTEVTATKAASVNNNNPATRAARLSASPCAALARNLHRTTTAEKSSMALSPPKASSAGLRARQAAKRDTTASTLIHAIVTVCTRWIRRIAPGEAVCSTEAIHDIMAPYSHGSRSKAPIVLRLLPSLERNSFGVPHQAHGQEPTEKRIKNQAETQPPILRGHEQGGRLAIRYRRNRLTYENYLALAARDAAPGK